MKDFEQTVISQYANSPTIMRLIHNMNTYIDPTADIDNFYDFIWNVDTAQGFGLDIWGEIVNISRYLLISEAQTYFGFQDGLSNADYAPFGQESFYSGEAAATQTYALSDDNYRTLIMAKALANISISTPSSINQLLRNIFGGRAYCVDLGNMMMQYIFEYVLTPLQRAIITQSGIMLRPTGVYATMMTTVLPCFGFSESGTYSAAPFGQAPFITEDAIAICK
jgi:hypothetical protein